MIAASLFTVFPKAEIIYAVEDAYGKQKIFKE